MTRLRTATYLSALLGIVSACADEGPMCTLIGCADSLGVELVPAGGAAALPDGAYVVSATNGAATLTCSFVRPVGEDPPTCELDDMVRWADATPTTTTIVVTRDGSTVATVSDVAPSYTSFRPNGPDCGPVCRGATVAVTIPAP